MMLKLGKKLLGVGEGDRIHVLCETSNCLPDPFQVLAKCTVGNKGLKIRDTGKMAVTITKHSPPRTYAEGVRIVLDPEKTRKYPKLHAWYMNTAKPSHEEVIEELKSAGEEVFSYNFVRVPVPPKEKKFVMICEGCGEAFIKRGEENLCIDCINRSDV